ncbi:MAG: acyl-CoA dehydrogenase [Gammaproteobacteria bacterium]|nr:acyl-CoA dehydrogenase [Gammaproteobacteria bacterium]NIM72420.1 acyl-CoA dehydrogenase [Gammaproteobacteria bacterium]NIN37287.1 acyl-CoA dehydrogenase [Gammaproteobacteria bacterium]NIO24177.1 acyl-CoA dehydrogenase [Gammaproteobacteria bacterium]NIO64784.1 acyl-CoA dehydrogenase [Gammaproteobacteria bacterium]
MSELNAQQRKLRDRAREVAEASIAPRAAEVDRSEEYPWDNVRALTEAGFMGMTIPPEFGGPGLSYMDAVLVVEEMARVCGVTGRIVVEGNMGAIGAIMAYGSDAQKRLAAELVLAGDKPAICITEPEAGSAATEMTTRAERRGDTYVINGRKHWITGGGVSKLHLIFARVFARGVEQGIGGFIAVRGESEGLVVGRREPAMGLRGIPETEMHFEDLELPADRLIEPPRGLARGFAGLMNAYNAQRVGAATVALGIAQGAYELALDYSQRREQFGRPICEFQGLQWMLVDMNIQLEAARALVHKAARGGDGGFPDIGDAARAKILASESAIRVTNDALQVFGAAGYSRNLPLERMARDARMFTIGGGTAQILRTVVASRILARKLPQTRDGYLETDTGEADRRAARG